MVGDESQCLSSLLVCRVVSTADLGLGVSPEGNVGQALVVVGCCSCVGLVVDRSTPAWRSQQRGSEVLDIASLAYILLHSLITIVRTNFIRTLKFSV